MNVGASHSSCSDQSRKTFAAPSAFKGRFPFIVRGSALAASSTLTPASAVLEPRGEGAMAAVDSNDPVVYIERIADTHRFVRDDICSVGFKRTCAKRSGTPASE